MIRQGHISRSQAVVVLWFVLATKVFLTTPSALLAEGFTAAWMITAGGAIVAGLGFIPSVLLVQRFGGQKPLAQAADEAGGLVLGKVFGLSAVGLLLVILALSLRQFAESLVIGILPRTPVEVIVLTFVLLLGYTAYAGLESIARLAVFLFIAGGELQDVDLRRLHPLPGPGLSVVAVRALVRSSLYAELLVLPVLFPYLRERSEAIPAGVWAVGLAAVLLTGTQIIFTGSFDVAQSERFSFPALSLARTLGGGRLVTRADAAFAFLWTFAAAVGLSVLLWAVTTLLAETLRLPDHRPLVAPLTSIAAAAALAPGGLAEAVALDFGYVRYWGWVVAFALPLGLWGLAVARGKRGDPDDQ